MSRKAVAVFLFLGLTALGSQAQTSVKELLDKGGKKLSTDQIKKMASGATLTGVAYQPNNKSFTFAFDLAPGGGLAGNAWTPEWMSPVKGSWTVGKGGLFCTHMPKAPADDRGNCANFYQIGDDLFAAAAPAGQDEAEPGAALQRRKFERIAAGTTAPAPAPAAAASQNK
ncbi:MAG: hypothetical protein KF686_13200 [Ramlibacter sp.]|nr:hypothetical protein [Ramlibacter sp.]MBX3657143.1 hypothetical protein [Ramlibacter sp.]